MLGNIKGIKFNSVFWGGETTISLFPKNDPYRINLVFGRNGSGKSTITRAIVKAIGKEENDILSAQFVDTDGKDIFLSEDENRRIFVFNEDYTHGKIRLMEDGLGTIVMFGDVIDIEEKIVAIEQEITSVQVRFNDQKEIVEKYNDKNNLLSPKHHHDRITSALRGDASWAGRERLILSGKHNASVTDTVIADIMKDAPSESSEDLSTMYDDKFNELQSIRSSGKKITASLPKAPPDYSDSIKVLSELLAMQLENPSLTKREQKLLLLAQQGRQEMLSDMRSIFSAGSTELCPYCLQPVSKEYKSELIQSVEKVLNKDAENHKTALERSIISKLTFDFSRFDIADKTLTDKCRTALTKIDDEMSKCNKNIEKKIGNLYTPITDFSSELQKLSEALGILILKLETKVNQYNSRLGNIGSLQDGLKLLNKKRAYYEVVS